MKWRAWCVCGWGLIPLPTWHVVRFVLSLFFFSIPSPLTVSEEWMRREAEREMEREEEIYTEAVGGVSVGDSESSGVGVSLLTSPIPNPLSQGNCRKVIGGSKWLIGDQLTWK